MNKKKIIIISISTILLIAISISIVLIIGKKEDNEEKQLTETTTVKEQESSSEENFLVKVEKTSEIESVIEETGVEESSTEPEVEPHYRETVGNYTEEIEGIFAIRTYENGAVRYFVYDSKINKYYAIEKYEYDTGEMPERVYVQNVEDNKAFIWNSASVSGIPYVEETIMQEPITQEIIIHPSVQRESILNWIRNNYGDKFVYNGENYEYVPRDNEYYSYINQKAHLMTGSNTFQLLDVYYSVKSYSVEYMAAMLGYPEALEGYDRATRLHNGVYDKNFEYIDLSNNWKYMKMEGCEEAEHYSANWEFMSVEGVPVSIDLAGYIRIDVIYDSSNESVSEKFTITEYHNFINNNKWSIKTEEKRQAGIGGNGKYTNKYLVIE